MKQHTDNAVSPVVGVMLMLVVTIIIAAVVSGFSGGLVKTQTKVPQATITSTFSVTSGLAITHAGGDPIPTSGIIIQTEDGPSFGPNLEAVSINAINMSLLTNSAGTPVAYYNSATHSVDGYNVTSFNSGDTWFVNITNCDPHLLQPGVVSRHGTYTPPNSQNPTWSFSSSTDSFWAMTFANPANIGKSFYLDVNDKASGALISRSVVTITG